MDDKDARATWARTREDDGMDEDKEGERGTRRARSAGGAEAGPRTVGAFLRRLLSAPLDKEPEASEAPEGERSCLPTPLAAALLLEEPLGALARARGRLRARRRTGARARGRLRARPPTTLS